MGELEEKSNNELALDRTDLAQLRSDLAQNRTLLAAERTYAAWIRTGFSIAGVGWTFGQLLSGSEGRAFTLLVAGTLILLGLMSFVYAWIGYKKVYDYIKETFRDDQEKDFPMKMNLITVTILSTALVIIFIMGYGLLLI